jgi:hypothetical protein
MPNSHPDDQPVSWGRFAEYQQRLDERFAIIEGQLKAIADVTTQRKSRQWTVTITVLAGLLLPLGVTAILAVLHHVRIS